MRIRLPSAAGAPAEAQFDWPGSAHGAPESPAAARAQRQRCPPSRNGTAEQLRSVRRNHDSAAPAAASSPTWPHYLTANRYVIRTGRHAGPRVTVPCLAWAYRASSLDSGSRSERAVFSGGGISSGRSELARWPFFSGGGSERADFSEQNHTQNRKNFPACGPQVGPQAKF